MKKEGQKRIDRKHRMTLRIEEVTHSEADALAFRQNISLNILYEEAVRWALMSDAFRNQLQEKFPRDERRGYYTYNVDTSVRRLGRRI